MLSSVLTGDCVNIFYGTNDNSKPSDRPKRIMMKMPLSMQAGLYFLATLTFIVIIFFMLILAYYRKTRLLKASQPSMMWIIVTANIFFAIRIISSASPATKPLCLLNIWTGHLGE